MSYEEALDRGRELGAAHADDASLLAMILDTGAQYIMGAVSPKLMWEGAQKKHLTTKEVAALMVNDPQAAEDLMWVE